MFPVEVISRRSSLGSSATDQPDDVPSVSVWKSFLAIVGGLLRRDRWHSGAGCPWWLMDDKDQHGLTDSD